MKLYKKKLWVSTNLQLTCFFCWQYILPILMENRKKLQGLTSNVVFL
jgi:hypothetical protein